MRSWAKSSPGSSLRVRAKRKSWFLIQPGLLCRTSPQQRLSIPGRWSAAKASDFHSIHDIYQEIFYALQAGADSLPSVDLELAVVQADRKSLRKQLRRGAAQAERHHREAGVARLGEDARLRDQRAEARGADRAEFHDSARALLRLPGRRGPDDRHHVDRAREGLRLVAALEGRGRRDGQRGWGRVGGEGSALA